MVPELNITHNDTEYTIALDCQHARHPERDTTKLEKAGYLHFSREFDLWFLISYNIRNNEILDINLKDYGKKPRVRPVDTTDIVREEIRDDIEDALGIKLSDDQLDLVIEDYVDGGRTILAEAPDDFLYSVVDHRGYVGTDTEVPLAGWDWTLKQLDIGSVGLDERNAMRALFTACKENSPNTRNTDRVNRVQEYVARLEFPELEDWQLRALELHQHSVLSEAVELSKTQALREQGLNYWEVAEKLGKHESTVSRQFSQLDEKWQRIAWTAENVVES